MDLNQQAELGHIAGRPLAQSVLGFRKRRSALLSRQLICAVDLADDPEPQPPAPLPPEKPLLVPSRKSWHLDGSTSAVAAARSEPDPEWEFEWLVCLSKAKCIAISEVRKFRKEFKRLDTDGNGTLSLEEFKEHLRDQCDLPKGQDIPAHLLDSHFREADRNGDNSLSFEEFLDWAVSTSWSEERLVTDSKERELRQLARAAGLSLPQVDKAKHCYDMFDLDNDGLINEDEFRIALDEILRIMDLTNVPPTQLKRFRLPFNSDGYASFKDFLPWYMNIFEGIHITLSGSGTCKQQGSGSTTDGSLESIPSSVAPRRSQSQAPTLAVVMEACHEEEAEGVSADEGLDSLAERLLRVQGSMEGKPFSEAGLALMRAAFGQFCVPHGHEVHRLDLAELLRHLGYVVASEAEVERLATECATYTELDFEGFLCFVEHYARYERTHLEEVFSSFDGGGGVPVEQIEGLTAAAGLVPRPAVVREALQAAFLGEAGSLHVFDFVRVLVAYRHKEGFTQDEVVALRRIFRSASAVGGQGGLATSALSGALTRMFGMQAKQQVSAMVKKLTHGGSSHSLGLHRSSLCAGGQEPLSLNFAEFLALSGRLAQALQQERHDEFERLDLDGSGSLSVAELKAALQHLEYEPRETVIREVLQEVDLEGDAQLGLDEFLNFITLFDMRDGFLLEELKEIENAFSMFDSDSSGTMCVAELREALTHLGYAVSLDSVHLLTATVDAGSGCMLGPSEFRRLVRIQRDVDLRKLRAAFEAYKEGEYLPAPGIASALNMAIGGSMEDVEELPASCQPEAATGGGLDYEAFVGLAEESRAARAARLRRSAGFSPEELQDFRAAFSAHDQDRRGQLNISEVKRALEDLGVACRSRWDQLALLEQLEAARTSAQLVGAEGLSHQGSETVGFWELVHLMRLLRGSSNRAAEEKVQQAARELGFSLDEVVEFRETFIRLKRRIEGSQYASVCLPQSSCSAAKDGILPTDIHRLLRSVGLSISSRQRETLERQIRLVECTSTGLVTFVGFLRIMRWLLDTDFVSINEVVARE